MANTKLSTMLATTAVLALAACGGGSSSVSNFQTLSNDGIALLNKHQNATLTPVQNIPIGNFNYSGVAAYSAINTSDAALILNNALAVSSIDLNANFSTNSISGSLSNFVDIDNYSASGSVPLTGSISGNGFTASGSAVLVSGFDGSNAFTSANINGAFFGDQAEVASGLMSASYGGISGSGVFIAER